MEDWGVIETFLIGEGYSQRQAFEVSYRELECKLEAAERKREHSWEVARWVVFNLFVLSPDLKRGDKPKKPQDLFKLQSEIKGKTKRPNKVEITDEDLKALKEIGLWG